MNADKPILVLDFDGVIHSYTSGWKGADVIPDPPVDGAAEFIREAVKHFRVAIFSSRSHQSGGIAAMKTWCAQRLPGVDQIEWPTEKPAAFITIDDRALTFDGSWPAIDDLKSFQPWNKP
jgi:hypothetical protein